MKHSTEPPPSLPFDHALVASWLERLRLEWRRINVAALGGALRPAVIEIDLAERRLGSWRRVGRRLTLSAHHIAQDPWPDVVQTLRHEMAHQYADEVLDAHDEVAHGAAFVHACGRLGVEPSAHRAGTSPPSGAGGDAGQAAESADPYADSTQRVLDRVRKLLALAGSDNQFEAEAAMTAAHRLLLRHNLDLRDAAVDANYIPLRIGASAVQLSLEQKLVAGVLTESFFVEAVWVWTYVAAKARDERILEIYGKRHDVEMASWVHDFLHLSLRRLFAGARGRGEVEGSARREYSAGVLAGFRDKLRREREQAAEAGLVWVGDADLDRFVRGRHRHLRTLSATGAPRGDAHALGRRDGQGLTLHRPVGRSSDDSGRGRLLSGPPPRSR
jgi:hypothetical protein